MRIVRASDDAAGLSISSLLKTDARVTDQAARNVSDGISALNIADGVTEELSNIVTRLKELAEQAANGTLSVTQRKPLQAEADQLVREYERITSSTEFNNIKLLYNAQGSIGVQSGYGSNNTLSIALGNDLSRNDGTGAYTLGVTLSAAANDSSATADFNGDGIPDLVFSSSAGSSAAVYIGNGNGTFAAVRTYAASGAGSFIDVQIGDFNNDGKKDLVLASNTGYLSVLHGNGDGSFRAAVSCSIGALTFQSVTVADFNNDGRDDVAVGMANGVMTINSTAGGIFTTASAYTNTTFVPSILVTGDLNNDGKIDLVAKDTAAGAKVFLGTGTGSFSSVINASAGSSNQGLALSDYNRDGILDLISSEATGFGIALGNGNGTFGTKTTYTTTGGNCAIFEARDMTGDGIMDIVSNTGTDIYFQKGNVNGTFTYVYSNPASSTRSGHLAIADFNQDGAMDIAASGGSDNAVYIATTSKSSTASYLYLLSAAGAREGLTNTTSALTRIAKERGVIGAYQERLTSSFSVLQQTREQLLSAASSIESADVAEEAANLVRNKILLQAGTAILAQSKNAPEIALKLLQAPSNGIGAR